MVVKNGNGKAVSRVNGRVNTPVVDFYKPSERTIYKYWDGQKTVQADPMVLFKKMMDLGAELFIEIKVAMSPSKDSGKAFASTIEKLRNLFGVQPFSEEGGLTEAEVLGLFDHFLLFIDDVKKKSKVYQTSPTGMWDPSVISSAASPPIPNSSDSGSTAIEPSTSDPTPSPSVSESPMGS